MDIFEFLQLTEEERVMALWKGVKVAERAEENMKYELYQFDDFYAEVEKNEFGFYKSISNTFVTTAFLEPYLEQIDISSLMLS